MNLKLPFRILLSIVFFILTSMQLWAYDFVNGGIYYTVTSSAVPYKVEVSSGTSVYTGTVNIPSTVTNGNTYAVTGIGDGAFQNSTGLTSVSIPSSVIKINTNAFNGCSSLTAVTIPSGVPAIENAVFYGCYALSSVSIPSTVSSIGINAFYNCMGLTSLNIPVGVTSIGSGAFYNCGLTSIVFPSTVTTIGGTALYNCTSLTSITFSPNITSLGDMLIWGCSSLTSITALGTVPATCLFTTFMGPTGCTLHVRAGYAAAYTAATGWSNFSSSTVADAVVGVKEASASAVQVSVQNGQLVIANVPVGKTLAIYNLQVTAIYNQQADAETVAVSLPAHGVYVVKAGQESIKVIY